MANETDRWQKLRAREDANYSHVINTGGRKRKLLPACSPFEFLRQHTGAKCFCHTPLEPAETKSNDKEREQETVPRTGGRVRKRSTRYEPGNARRTSTRTTKRAKVHEDGGRWTRTGDVSLLLSQPVTTLGIRGVKPTVKELDTIKVSEYGNLSG